MAITQNRKASKAISNLLSRQDYLVTQANDLAKSFGNLTIFQHKVLDFCFSFVQANDPQDKEYQTNAIDIIRHFGLGASGASYLRVSKTFKALNENTAIYMRILEGEHVGILMTSLFDHISMLDDGVIKFQFSRKIAPYVFQLKKRFYSFHLSELSRVRSKYTLSLMKLWNANGIGNWKPAQGQLPDAVIEGSLDDWESWFLGSDQNGKQKHWSAGRFRQKVLNVAIKELGELYPKIILTTTTYTDHRKVTGYRIEIHPLHTYVKP